MTTQELLDRVETIRLHRPPMRTTLKPREC